MEESTQTNPKELANMLDRSATKLMNYFQGLSTIPNEIWDALGDIDIVKKELLLSGWHRRNQDRADQDAEN